MNIQYYKPIYVIYFVTALFIGTNLYAGSAINSVDQPQDSSTAGNPTATSKGRFFAYDQETRKIWINDFVYFLSTDYRVIGSSTKLGSLSAIKYQEVVAFKTAPNPKHPSAPYIIEIRRK